MKNNRKNRKLIFIIYKNHTTCRMPMPVIIYTLPKFKFSKRHIITYALYCNSVMLAAAGKYKINPRLLLRAYPIDTPTFVNRRDLEIKKQWAIFVNENLGVPYPPVVLPGGTLETLGTNNPVRRPRRNLTMIIDDIDDDAPQLGTGLFELLNARMKDPPKNQYLTMIGHDVYLNGKKIGGVEEINFKTNDKNENDK